jgi:hypothetical protein
MIIRHELMRLRRLGLRRRSAALAAILICGCQSTSGSSSPVSPLPPDFPAGCTADFAVAEMNRLLSALGTGNPDAVAALIVPPAPHQDGLELTPSISGFLASRPATDLQVHERADLELLVADTKGLEFDLDGPPSVKVGIDLQSGPGAYTGPGLSMGPVLWRASGGRVTAAGHHLIKGGGKALIQCPSGLFVRALFSPISFA